MTDNEIIKALECCCAKENCEVVSCEKCPLEKHYECKDIMFHETVDLINRQKAEIERLSNFVTEDRCREIANEMIPVVVKQARAEAIKELAKRLKKLPSVTNCEYEWFHLDIDNLVKEMAGENNG